MNKISINDIYDKNINFIIGSGASYGLFPTLALKIPQSCGRCHTYETLAEFFLTSDKKHLSALLFMDYYTNCIKKVIDFSMDGLEDNTIKNYKLFIELLITILQNKQKSNRKSCNIFTTNYDGCFALVAESILAKNNNFIINDGSKGFKKNYLEAKNFNLMTSYTGAFNRHIVEIPQINIIHLHGSVYWGKEAENIVVNYNYKPDAIIFNNDTQQKLSQFTKLINDKNQKAEEINEEDFCLTDEIRADFWSKYNLLPIVNPTKWKFHETVFEEHYYQMLRLMSYELEKENSIFITFGFSFADEHILNLVKRSLSNPTLLLYICCFNRAELTNLNNKFKGYKNVNFIALDKDLDFTEFNSSVFSLTKTGDK